MPRAVLMLLRVLSALASSSCNVDWDYGAVRVACFAVALAACSAAPPPGGTAGAGFDVVVAAPNTGAEKMPDPAADHELVPFEEGSKWGYLDRRGNVVIAAKYDRADEFAEGLGAVYVGGTPAHGGFG